MGENQEILASKLDEKKKKKKNKKKNESKMVIPNSVESVNVRKGRKKLENDLELSEESEKKKKEEKDEEEVLWCVVVFGKNSNNSKYSPLNAFADCKLPENVLECC